MTLNFLFLKLVGISWNMLLELDYQSYREVASDYIPLPVSAQTNKTVVRIWQPFIIDEETGYLVFLAAYSDCRQQSCALICTY